MPLRSNYDFLQGYDYVLVNTETIDEVMTDKIVAFPATGKYIRHRDIWDLAWLTQQGAKLDPEMVMKKVSDYSIENYPAILDEAMARLPDVVKGAAFKDQMVRFIDSETIARTLEDGRFLDYLVTTVNGLFSAMRGHLSGGKPASEFSMS